MSDCQFFQVEAKKLQLQAKFGVTNKLVVTYFGAAGKANHLEYLVEAARSAKKKNKNLHFLVVAYGSELNTIKNLAKRYQLDNVDFLKYCNREGLRQVLNVTDVVYVSYANVPILSTGSPNKFFDSLAAGKLVLVNFKGWLKHVAEEHCFGHYIDPEKPEMLADILTPLVQNRDELLRYQNNARLIAETFFSRSLAVQKLLKFLCQENQQPAKEPEVYNLTA
jgi:glycosyltransferase involved in cell wall biosynthesis